MSASSTSRWVLVVSFLLSEVDAMSLVGRAAENHPQQVGVRGALDAVDDRRTPSSLFDPLNEEFKFTLDAAASADNALCEHFYSLDSDGLTSSWVGHSVWVNPPYSDCGAWVRKAWAEFIVGCPSIVMLLPANRCEQVWWQNDIEPFRDGKGYGLRTRFQRGRLRFDTPDHDYAAQPKGNRPPFGVVVVIWRGE